MGTEAQDSVKTQKAKGILALSQYRVKTFTTEMVKQAKVFPHDPLKAFPFFARPCPMVPRHGFVESRTVMNMADWGTVTERYRDGP